MLFPPQSHYGFQGLGGGVTADLQSKLQECQRKYSADKMRIQAQAGIDAGNQAASGSNAELATLEMQWKHQREHLQEQLNFVQARGEIQFQSGGHRLLIMVMICLRFE